MHDVAFKSAGKQLIHVNKIDFGMILLFFWFWNKFGSYWLINWVHQLVLTCRLMNVSIKEVSISLGCFNYCAKYCDDSITVQMISLVRLYFRPFSFYAVSLWSYFKTIKQLICCDNHSHLCQLDYFDFECFRVKVFIKLVAMVTR